MLVIHKPDYWSSITENNSLYQMGAQSHRVFITNFLRRRAINSLLDVGCGTGPVYQLIKKNYNQWKIRYKGVDPSPAFIKTCKHHFPEADWEVQNATNLKEKDQSWSAVLFMHSLDYVADYKKALAEANRVATKFIIIDLWQPIDYRKGAENRINISVNPDDEYDWSTARLQHFAWDELKKVFSDLKLKVFRKEDGKIVNKEGKHNTVIILGKEA